MQESKESLERLRRMGAFEAQDFDNTVSTGHGWYMGSIIGKWYCIELYW